MDKIVNKPLVSIIMPAYNASNYIQEAIDSVLAQTYTNWELIIVDDGSTDDTATIIKKYLNADKRIFYFYQVNGKQGKARNLAISKSKGEYLAFLDADDFWLPEKLDIQLKEIKINKVDLVFSDSFIFSDLNNSIKKKNMNTLNMILKGEEAIRLFVISNRIPILTVLVKREKIILVNGFSENKSIQNAEDYHLWLKLLLAGSTFYGSEKILAYYRLHEKSSTGQDKNASKQIPEVLYDLAQKNQKSNKIINWGLKSVLRKQNNALHDNKKDFNNVIEENCRYLGKQSHAKYYKIINFVFGIKMTKKFLNYFLYG